MEQTLRARPFLLWLASLAGAVVLSLCAVLAYASFDDIAIAAQEEPVDDPFDADDDPFEADDEGGDDTQAGDDETAQPSFMQPVRSVPLRYPERAYARMPDRAPPNHILDLEPRPPCPG